MRRLVGARRCSRDKPGKERLDWAAADLAAGVVVNVEELVHGDDADQIGGFSSQRTRSAQMNEGTAWVSFM